jgi:hypothetical protein
LFSAKDCFYLALSHGLLSDPWGGRDGEECDDRHQGEEGNKGITVLIPVNRGL